MKRKHVPSRRDAVLGVAALAAVGSATAAEKPGSRAADEALLAIVRARYGKGLTEVQWQAVQQRIRGGIARAADLRKYKLRNSDDPVVAYRADLP